MEHTLGPAPSARQPLAVESSRLKVVRGKGLAKCRIPKNSASPISAMRYSHSNLHTRSIVEQWESSQLKYIIAIRTAKPVKFFLLVGSKSYGAKVHETRRSSSVVNLDKFDRPKASNRLGNFDILVTWSNFFARSFLNLSPQSNLEYCEMKKTTGQSLNWILTTLNLMLSYISQLRYFNSI